MLEEGREGGREDAGKGKTERQRSWWGQVDWGIERAWETGARGWITG